MLEAEAYLIEKGYTADDFEEFFYFVRIFGEKDRKVAEAYEKAAKSNR